MASGFQKRYSDIEVHPYEGGQANLLHPAKRHRQIADAASVHLPAHLKGRWHPNRFGRGWLNLLWNNKGFHPASRWKPPGWQCDARLRSGMPVDEIALQQKNLQ